MGRLSKKRETQQCFNKNRTSLPIKKLPVWMKKMWQKNKQQIDGLKYEHFRANKYRYTRGARHLRFNVALLKFKSHDNWSKKLFDFVELCQCYHRLDIIYDLVLNFTKIMDLVEWRGPPLSNSNIIELQVKILHKIVSRGHCHRIFAAPLHRCIEAINIYWKQFDPQLAVQFNRGILDAFWKWTNINEFPDKKTRVAIYKRVGCIAAYVALRNLCNLCQNSGLNLPPNSLHGFLMDKLKHAEKNKNLGMICALSSVVGRGGNILYTKFCTTTSIPPSKLLTHVQCMFKNHTVCVVLSENRNTLTNICIGEISRNHRLVAPFQELLRSYDLCPLIEKSFHSFNNLNLTLCETFASVTIVYFSTRILK